MVTYSPQPTNLPYKLVKFSMCYGLTIQELANSYVETLFPREMY